MLVQVIKLFNVVQEWSDEPGEGVISTLEEPVYVAVPTNIGGFPAINIDELAKKAGILVEEDTGDVEVTLQHFHLTQRCTDRNMKRYEYILHPGSILVDLEVCIFGPTKEANLPFSVYQLSRLAWTHGPIGCDRRTESELEGSWEYEAIMQTLRGYVKQNGNPDKTPEPFIYVPPNTAR